MKTKHPYAVPARLSPNLMMARAYWERLLRGGATMPFSDDLKLTDLPDLAGHLFLIGVLGPQTRFRFDLVGQDLATDGVAGGVAGKFLDEIEPQRPFAFLLSQCAATLECAKPTCFVDEEAALPYARLLLPLWGDGRISMLLGAIDVA